MCILSGQTQLQRELKHIGKTGCEGAIFMSGDRRKECVQEFAGLRKRCGESLSP